MKADFIVLLSLLSLATSSHLFGGETPLSFESLHENEAIQFSVNGAPKRGGSQHFQYIGRMIFDITVHSYPRRSATIVLPINATMIVPVVEKVWGHKIGQKVEKPLTSDDIAYLDSFFSRYQAKGEITPDLHDPRGWMGFDFLKFFGPKSGDWGRIKTQCYPLDPELDAEFFRRFIGIQDG
jgi:hypothetical protein